MGKNITVKHNWVSVDPGEIEKPVYSEEEDYLECDYGDYED